MKRIGVITSGGDCQGMNQVLYSLARACENKGIELVGFYRGYEGILLNKKVKLSSEKLKAAAKTGGTVLKSTRCLAMKESAGQDEAYRNLQKNKIEGLVVIGGDGSAKGAEILTERFNFPTVVIPATIDNDLPGVNLSLGYLSAIDRAVTQIGWINDTAKSHDRVIVVEVMGRHSGNLAKGISKQVKPLAMILPGTAVDEDLFKEIAVNFKKNKSNVVIITELQEAKLATLMGFLNPRYEVRFNSLGHGQRGGPPTSQERQLASQYAKIALKNLLQSKTGVVVL